MSDFDADIALGLADAVSVAGRSVTYTRSGVGLSVIALPGQEYVDEAQPDVQRFRDFLLTLEERVDWTVALTAPVAGDSITHGLLTWYVLGHQFAGPQRDVLRIKTAQNNPWFVLVIQAGTWTTSADGQRTATWATYDTVLSRVMQTGGAEGFVHRKQTPEQSYTLIVPSTASTRAITTAMRLLLPGGETLQIASVRDMDLTQQMVEITAQRAQR